MASASAQWLDIRSPRLMVRRQRRELLGGTLILEHPENNLAQPRGSPREIRELFGFPNKVRSAGF